MSTSSISEYSASIDTPQMIKANMLKGGQPVKKNGRLTKYAGGFCVVYPYETATKKYAVRCWHVGVEDIRQRTKRISDTLKSTNLPYFVGFEFVTEGILTAQGPQDIVVMDWVNGNPLKTYIAKNISNPQRLVELANAFKKMVVELHSLHIAHGDLQHGNILVDDNGNIVLVDYDSIYVPALSGYSDDIKGLVGYQHPSRWENETLNEKVDYFSELIIYTSLVALSKYPNLWFELNLEDTETLLFSADDISSKGRSNIFQLLLLDSELKLLATKLKEYLNKDNINDLEPLEKAIIDPKDKVAKELSGEWEDNGYEPKTQSQNHFNEITQTVRSEWNK
ncbi:MAG: protein kinase family protein [Bacteroidales bacterium]|nr:protein kinase family protein [Bacteroidales bacterium]